MKGLVIHIEVGPFVLGARWCVTYPGCIMEYFWTEEAARKFIKKKGHGYLYHHGIYHWKAVPL